MCTLSIFPTPHGFLFTMNRDEQRSRLEEKHLHLSDGHCFPVDAPSQGTWVGVNHAGMAFALLNRYQDPQRGDAQQSRGAIIANHAHHSDWNALYAALQELPFEAFNPFDLIVQSAQQPRIHVSWNGASHHITTQPLDQPFFISSSSERTEEVLAYRHALFKESLPSLSDTPDAEHIIRALHLRCDESMERSAILMQRELTHTKSLTQIEVSHHAATMRYWSQEALASGAPNDSALTHSLPRIGALQEPV